MNAPIGAADWSVVDEIEPDEPVPSSHHTRYLVLLAVLLPGYLLVRNHPWT